MKIKEFKIYGFGKWKDFSASLSGDQLSLVTGKNEAGKSTLYHFILFMLFGLPPKQREFYLPKNGGPLGGQLCLETHDYGRVIIERIHDRDNGRALCRLESGHEFGEEWLQQLLDGMERKGYETTYGFNADDLLRLQHLSGNELGEVLLNIGLTGSDQIYQAEKWLQKQLDSKFKPKGKKPEINAQMEIVEQLEQKKKKLESEEGEYFRLQEDKQTKVEQIEELEKAWTAKTNEIYAIEQLLKTRPLLVEYYQMIGKEKEQQMVKFPEAGVERYYQLKEKMLPLQSEEQLLQSNLKELYQAADELKEVKNQEVLNEGKWLHDVQRNEYEKASFEYDRLQQQFEKIKEQLKQELTYIDAPLEEHELEEYPLPFYIEETWRDLKNEKEELDREQTFYKEQETDIEREFNKIEKRKHTIEEKRISENQRRELEEKLQNTYESAVTADEGNTSRLKKRRLYAISAAIGTFVVGSLFQTITSSLEVFIVMLIIGLFFVFYSYNIHKKIESYPLAADQLAIPSHEMEEARWQLQQDDKQMTEWNHLHEQWKQLNQEEIRLQEKKRLLFQRQTRLEAAMREQKNLYPFLTSLKVQHWEKLYHLLVHAKDKKLELLRMEKESQSFKKTMKQIEDDLRTFFSDRKWEFNEDNMKANWQHLQDWVYEQERVDVRINELEKKIRTVQHQLKENTTRLYAYYDEKESLFKEAEVNSEEAFYDRAKQKEVQQERQAKILDLEGQLKGMLSEKEQRDFQVWEAVPEESELLSRLNTVKLRKEGLEEERKQTQQSLADTKSEISRLENSDERSSITHRLQAEKEKLQRKAREWTIYQLALKSLEKTKQTYKDKYLPQVINKAINYIIKLTEGKYVDIYIHAEDEKVRITDREGIIYLPEELSRGTRDQLYVAFRFALGETMADKSSMPFLIDDAFVHFDSTRLRIMTEIIEELASRHQVVLFTWKGELDVWFQSPDVLHL
ncbi:Uncharacterized protein YhaN [Halobacillus dabanensis]|uniref:Uncharacterized protein YhaN n=1 Tax=Halobacillus dabanensis TaxID=240302 RepID=A0A1I3SXS2_HALDA|nr:AAA family ATPase [Halobacillus dabanensis]SFJ63230.1 Uncharacterized protein YhaN [Halobacillus dabanensis]